MPKWTDEELVEAFEACTLANEDFRHEQHVRVAWVYLSRMPPLAALERFSTALRRFAAHYGADGLYHETITWAYVFLIQERRARGGEDEPWKDFRLRNRDLMVFKGGSLERYYRPETLQSELARRVFVLPDRGLLGPSAGDSELLSAQPQRAVEATEPATAPSWP
jgi:hypothetical protein